jgi:hypothetical protein
MKSLSLPSLVSFFLSLNAAPVFVSFPSVTDLCFSEILEIFVIT